MRNRITLTFYRRSIHDKDHILNSKNIDGSWIECVETWEKLSHKHEPLRKRRLSQRTTGKLFKLAEKSSDVVSVTLYRPTDFSSIELTRI